MDCSSYFEKQCAIVCAAIGTRHSGKERTMKVWLGYRLSRDEDDELNSLTNQRKIIYEYAVTNGHEVVGESFDDNVSGMHFNREGIDKIYEVVEAGKIEAIIVKDLSGWADTERRQPCLSTTCGNTTSASSRQRKISIRSMKTTISSLASRVWSMTSMPATAAAVCGLVIVRSRKRAL